MYYQKILQIPCPYLRTGSGMWVFQSFAMPTHTYHRFGLSVVLCDDLYLSLLGSLLLISPLMHSIWMPLILDDFFEYRFLSRVWLLCKEDNENSQWGNLHILLVLKSASYLSTLTLSIPSHILDHQSVSFY